MPFNITKRGPNTQYSRRSNRKNKHKIYLTILQSHNLERFEYLLLINKLTNQLDKYYTLQSSKTQLPTSQKIQKSSTLILKCYGEKTQTVNFISKKLKFLFSSVKMAISRDCATFEPHQRSLSFLHKTSTRKIFKILTSPVQLFLTHFLEVANTIFGG